MPRREFSRKTKAEAFLRCGGHCEGCTALLAPARIEYDHIIPDSLGGEPTLENCRVICAACHRVKTGDDAGNLARALRREAKHIGASAPARRPMPGSRGSPYRKKLNGEVVLRTTKPGWMPND